MAGTFLCVLEKGPVTGLEVEVIGSLCTFYWEIMNSATIMLEILRISIVFMTVILGTNHFIILIGMIWN